LYGKGLENGSFLPFIINFAKSEKKMKLFGKGKREQDYLHVEDAAELCVKALFSENNHIYLGATGDSTSNKKVAEIISEEIEGFGEIELPDQEEKAPSFYFDASWTQKTLDWHPKKTIENGIKEMML
jgi:nucleoside-diphosphate-sugar epimerase